MQRTKGVATHPQGVFSAEAQRVHPMSVALEFSLALTRAVPDLDSSVLARSIELVRA